jgi:hypothetical protein
MNTIRADMADNPLAVAAREVNNYAETHGLKETCERFGQKLEDVHYIAEQRALRCVVAASRGLNISGVSRPVMVKMTDDEHKLFLTLTMAYVDGLMIGWRANQIAADRK